MSKGLLAFILLPIGWAFFILCFMAAIEHLTMR